jgi:SpoIIAA-like
MITLKEGLPAHVVVAEAHGTVTADDYEQVLIPAVDQAASGGSKMRMLYVLGDDFDGFDAKAGVDDTRLGLSHWRDFERIGVATDHSAYRAMVKGLGFLLPGEVRVFDMADLDAAVEWVSGT